MRAAPETGLPLSQQRPQGRASSEAAGRPWRSHWAVGSGPCPCWAAGRWLDRRAPYPPSVPLPSRGSAPSHVPGPALGPTAPAGGCRRRAVGAQHVDKAALSECCPETFPEPSPTFQFHIVLPWLGVWELLSSREVQDLSGLGCAAGRVSLQTCAPSAGSSHQHSWTEQSKPSRSAASDRGPLVGPEQLCSGSWFQGTSQAKGMLAGLKPRD
ncbi:unnamed protein product [Rangifer tarandus platyrhynchus]|uniref:Uncharacterized protein n=1 Tax=Rangifer tarandus platyrhynchus TaxID=3082113 RepID=A0ACB1MMT8_RANTA